VTPKDLPEYANGVPGRVWFVNKETLIFMISSSNIARPDLQSGRFCFELKASGLQIRKSSRIACVTPFFLLLPPRQQQMDAEIIFRYFTDLTQEQKEQFVKLGELYAYWNARINVISRKDMDNFYIRHVLHSLAIAKVVQFKAFTEVMDAGTGGGFPGVPLAILFPDVSFYLVDSTGKKIKVVNEVVSALGLKNVKAQQIRMEQVDSSFDFIVSRAVTALPDFVRWTQYKFHRKSFNDISNGILYLKGGDVKEELKQVKGLKKRIYTLSDFFAEPFFETKKLVHLFRK